MAKWRDEKKTSGGLTTMTDQLHAPVIAVQGLEKSFKDVHVLRGVNLEIARGSIFALLGSNGSGKTTTVKILSTLLKADAGTVMVNGYDVATARRPGAGVDQPDRPVRRRRRDPHRTGEPRPDGQAPAPAGSRPDRRGPARPLLAHRRRRPEGRDLLRRHEAPARHRDEPDRRPADHLPRRADHGPRPAGAPRGVGHRSRASPPGGTTVLLTTQYLDEAEQLADRIAILHEGTIIVNGTLAELKQLYPPAKVEYVEKQPSLEDIFLAITGDPSAADSAAEN